jgi:hypothetical protein
MAKMAPLLAMAIQQLTRKPKKTRLVHITSRLLEYGQKFLTEKQIYGESWKSRKMQPAQSSRIDKVLVHGNPNDTYRCGI